MALLLQTLHHCEGNQTGGHVGTQTDFPSKSLHAGCKNGSAATVSCLVAHILLSVKIPLRSSQNSAGSAVWIFIGTVLRGFFFSSKFIYLFLQITPRMKTSEPRGVRGTSPNKNLIHSLRIGLTLLPRMLIWWFVENPTSCNSLLNFTRGPRTPRWWASQATRVFTSFFLGLSVSNGLFGSPLLYIKAVMWFSLSLPACVAAEPTKKKKKGTQKPTMLAGWVALEETRRQFGPRDPWHVWWIRGR